MKGIRLSIAAALLAALSAVPVAAGEPDYGAWNEILATYYDPGKGMDYGRLRKQDYPKLSGLVETLSRVEVAKLDRNAQLAYWLNYYNISTVKLIVDNYPVESIRDLSTSLINKYQVFDREVVPLGGRTVALNFIEHEMIRKGFKDPRIHFAINCAARSCPPMRRKAFTGTNVQAQLEDQTRVYLDASVRIERSGDRATLLVTKIMDWFDDDFDDWGGGVEAFVRKYLSPGNASKLDGVRRVSIEYQDYDWSLNDWKS